MKRISTLKVVVLSTLLGVVVCTLGTVGIVFFVLPYYLPDLSSQYGKVEVVVNGKPLYFRREARGLNFDERILSPNGDICAGYNPELDIRFSSIDATIYYRIEAEALVLLEGNPPSFPSKYIPEEHIAKPKSFPVEIQVLEPTKLIVFESESLYSELNLRLLKIPLDKTLTCG